MNYLVIDLEMCNVPRDYRSRSYKYANETIQIGAVLLDEEFKRIGTLSQYVHPEHGVIDPFIQNLTGIRNSQVKKAPRIEEALLHMIDWIGDREYKVYAWSGSDRAQLLHEIKAKKICDERILDFVCEARWIDYQDVFVKRFGGLRFFIQQGQQVGIVHLVQKVDRGFFVLVCTVNQDVKIVPGFGSHGDKLLVAVKIIHQCCVAFGRDRYTLRLHAASGSFLVQNFRQRFRGRVRAACKSGHGKGTEAEQDSQQSGSETVPVVRFHRRHPPVCGTG